MILGFSDFDARACLHVIQLAAFEYGNLLTQLNRDDLPRFLARFKELLNVNTINEIANFNAQLARERETIKERIAHINKSLGEIDYNPGRYIVLESQASPDAEIRDFQQELRACTEGALTGDAEGEGEQYSEARSATRRSRATSSPASTRCGSRPTATSPASTTSR